MSRSCHIAGVRIPSAILKIVFRHILLFLLQFRLWRAAVFVSSPIHLLYIGAIFAYFHRHSSQRAVNELKTLSVKLMRDIQLCRAVQAMCDRLLTWLNAATLLLLDAVIFSDRCFLSPKFHPLSRKILLYTFPHTTHLMRCFSSAESLIAATARWAISPISWHWGYLPFFPQRRSGVWQQKILRACPSMHYRRYYVSAGTIASATNDLCQCHHHVSTNQYVLGCRQTVATYRACKLLKFVSMVSMFLTISGGKQNNCCNGA